MDNYLLSDKTVELLKRFSLHSPIDDSDIDTSSDSFQYLCSYEFICCSYTSLDKYGFPVKTQYSITELGKAYLDSHQRYMESFESLKKNGRRCYPTS